jgi:hypothetical protein
MKMKAKLLFCLALVLGNHLLAGATATNNPSSSQIHNWQYIQYPWFPHGPTFCVGWPSGGREFSMEMSRGLRLDILEIPQRPAFFKTNSITATLYRANGEVVEPTPEGKSLLNSPAYLQTVSFPGEQPAPQVMTYFPWGSNVLEECWIEVTIPPERYWVEVPYGFDRNPAEPLASANTNGPPGFFPLKSLTKHDHVVRWQNVHYDLGELQNGWRLSLIQSNADEAGSEVVLDPIHIKMSSAKSWDAAAWKTNSPTTALQILDATGTVIGSHFLDAGLRYDGMGYTYNLARYGDDQRCWGQVEISVGDKTYGVVVPSSLYKYTHGHARL